MLALSAVAATTLGYGVYRWYSGGSDVPPAPPLPPQLPTKRLGTEMAKEEQKKKEEKEKQKEDILAELRKKIAERREGYDLVTKAELKE